MIILAIKKRIMSILIVSATETEVKPIIENNDISKDIKFLITGIGMVATAYALGREFSRNTYNFAINAGIAGSYRRGIKIGNVVRVITDRISEMGAEDGEDFIEFHNLGVEKLSERFKNDGIYRNYRLIKSKTYNSLKEVNSITVNTIHGNKKRISKISKQFNPDIEAMEGAAFMYACDIEQIPYIQIRAISNYVEKRNTLNWDVKLAIENLNITIKKILTEIEQKNQKRI